MPFKKDDERINRNGRPKGSPNRTTAEIKSLLNQFISKNLDDIQQQYDELDAKEKLQFFERVLKYVIPQQSSYSEQINVDDLSEEQLDSLVNKILDNEKE